MCNLQVGFRFKKQVFSEMMKLFLITYCKTKKPLRSSIQTYHTTRRDVPYKVIMDKSRSEVSLLEQDTIENVF